MWFKKLILTFFFSIDSIVYNFIPSIYNLLIDISKTSILSQADIKQFTDKIYTLLGIFMLFKVAFSLIQYVVNPDDFSDKSKGVAKLGTNAVISLCILVLTPYIFNYAYQLQTIVLEENVLGQIIFGDTKEEGSDYLNTAGDKMAFMTMSAFFKPNVSFQELTYCNNLTIVDEDDKKIINPDCFGIKNDSGSYKETETDEKHDTLLTIFNNEELDKTILYDYVAGIEHENMGLMFRLNLATATYTPEGGEEEFIIEYQYIFSTIVGVVIILLLAGFILDVALRSIKLSFLQIIAPIPIISYMDPKSGKDGMFSKWYKMCFSTFLSLFIRLLALYFGIYIISIVGDGVVDFTTGAYVTSPLINIIIIIGVLMFAKQLPKILEGMGIKLDSGGKFTLNPLKKVEEEALGGKNLTGMARGALVGTAGMLTGAGIGRGLSGAWRGLTSGKGWSETGKAETEMNRKMRQARLDGSTFASRMGAKLANGTGLISASEMIAREKDEIEGQQKRYDDQIKSIEDRIAPTKRQIADQKRFADAVKSMETRAKDEIQNGNGGAIGKEYLRLKAEFESLKNTEGSSAEAIADAEAAMNNYLNEVGMKDYMTAASLDENFDKTFTNMRKNAVQAGNSIGIELSNSGDIIHGQFGKTKGKIGELERSIFDDEQQIESIKVNKASLGDQLRDINDRERIAKANESVVK